MSIELSELKLLINKHLRAKRVPLKTLRDIIDCSVHIPVYLGDDKLTLDIEGNKSVHIKGSGPWKVISGYNYSQPWEVEYKSLKKSA